MLRATMLLAVLAGAITLYGREATRTGQEEEPVKAPELEGGKGWINTDKPVTIASLKGKVVLLDFWTYC